MLRVWLCQAGDYSSNGTFVLLCRSQVRFKLLCAVQLLFQLSELEPKFLNPRKEFFLVL